MTKQIPLPKRLFIRFVIWDKLTNLTQKLYRKVNWKRELVEIAIHNHMNEQLKREFVSYPPKK